MSGIEHMRPRGGHLGLILPLVSTAATVGISAWQYPMLFGFLNARPRITGKPVSRFWNALTRPAIVLMVPLSILSSVSGIVCSRWLRTHLTLETTSVSNWYFYGGLMAAGHLAFAPFMIDPINKLVDGGQDIVTQSDEEIQEANEKELKRWLVRHTIRTLTVDLAALVCFAEGVAQSLWII